MEKDPRTMEQGSEGTKGELAGVRVAILAETLYEDLELWYPYYRLREAGADVFVVGSGSAETYQSKHGYPVTVDAEADTVTASQFDAVIIPGGYSPDHMRRHPGMVKLVREARALGVQRVVGMRNGVQGALRDELVDLSGIDDAELDLLKRTPSSALGSCRYRFRAGDAAKIVALCQREAIDALIYIGGNDSADTSAQIMRAAGSVELRVVGVPKTIDNDLPATDHCPGYGSAAR